MKKSCSILVLIAILVSCSSQPIPDTKESLKPTKEIISKPSESPDTTPAFLLTAENIEKVVNSKLVQSNNSFGTKLFLNIAKENLKNNVFISPISASIALQMLYNGADGKTKEEMSRILEIDKFSLDELNSLNRILSTKLSNPAEDITLNVANSVWANSKQTEFIPQFSKNLKTFYNSESKDIDFSSNGSSEIVNQWCSDKTNKKIEKIFEKGALEKSQPMSILINAIYFKADWQRKFKKEDTHLLREFKDADSFLREVNFMSDFREFKYYNHSQRYENGKFINENNKFEIAGVDYGKDGKLSLYIFLPDQDSSLQEFYKDLTGDNIDEWINKMFKTTGYVVFPKFKNKQHYDLKTHLKKQGMNLVFDKDFSNLSKMVKLKEDQLAYVSDAFQDSFIDVNEEGSEAAAVTVITASSTLGSSDPSSILRFMADRPFFYIIRDNETKSNLFMGSVVNPEYK